MNKLYFKIQSRIYLLITLSYLVLGLSCSLLFYLFLPEKYFGFYPLIGVFYWACGMALNFYLHRCRSNHPDKLVNIFMTVRMVKFVFTVVILVIAFKLIGVARLPFVIALMSNYLIFIVLELYIFNCYNKRIHRNDIAKKH